jgi:hypothetical protein
VVQLAKVTGVSNVIRNLKKANVKIGNGLSKGLKRGGLFLQRESQLIVPVDLGILNKTANTVNIGGEGFATDIVVHYGDGVNYAIFVHEDLEARHKPGKTAKYLEKPAREKRREILNIISEEAGSIK